MSKKIIGVIVLIIVIGSLGLVFNKTVGRKGSGFLNNKIYPETNEPPVLELVWPGELNLEDVTRYTPYGVWEDWFEYEDGIAYEPANEMQFYIKTNESNFLAVSPGIVTQNDVFKDGVGLVSVRYGENYAVTYMHILPSEDLKNGDIVETGDVLGKMEKKPHSMYGEETWWEIQLTEKRGDTYRTLPPYDYFSPESQSLFDQIAQSSKESMVKDSETGSYWTITDKCSWIKYTGEPSWWASNRLSFSLEKESEKEFIDNLELGWSVGDNYGRIIGPKDKCK